MPLRRVCQAPAATRMRSVANPAKMPSMMSKLVISLRVGVVGVRALDRGLPSSPTIEPRLQDEDPQTARVVAEPTWGRRL